jgi:hypothetical protein
MSQKTSIAATLLLALLALLAIALAVQHPATPVLAGDVGTYEMANPAIGTTAYITTGGNLVGWDVAGYGSVVVHAISDASATTSTLTITPQYSNETGVPCSAISHWFTGTDYIAYSTAAQYYRPVNYTVNSTSSLPISFTSTGSTTITGTGSVPYVITSTYTYGSAAAMNSAAAGYVAVDQSLALTGDIYGGREFAVYGRCMRLNIGVSYGTITPTIYVMMRDIGQ